MARPFRSVTLALTRISCGETEVAISPGGPSLTREGSLRGGGKVLAKSPNMRGLILRMASLSGPSPLRTIARAASVSGRSRKSFGAIVGSTFSRITPRCVVKFNCTSPCFSGGFSALSSGLLVVSFGAALPSATPAVSSAFGPTFFFCFFLLASGPKAPEIEKAPA